MPETMAIEWRTSSECPTIEPAIWRVGRSPGEKAVGASTNARKIRPPSQTTNESSMRKRRNDMRGIIELAAIGLARVAAVALGAKDAASEVRD
jgi:hypothetical protein